jgi:dipeptidase E
MKKLFLSSSVNFVAKDIASRVKDAGSLKGVFIPTAAEVEDGDLQWLKDDRQGLVDAGFNLFDYTITGKRYDEIEKDLRDVDFIHVNGGNTFYLLLQARKSGFDKFVRKAVKDGKIYSGSSAGSIIASPNIEIANTIESKTYEKELGSFEGFGITDVITFPHWGSDSFKDLYLNHRLDMTYKKGNKIILLNDDQYLLVESENLRIIDISKDL